jgi:uridine kinase
MSTKTYHLNEKTSLLSIMKQHHIEAMCANVDGRLRELDYVLEGTHQIEFLTLLHDAAMRIYETTLRFLLTKVIFEIDPSIEVKFHYSVSRAIYVDLSAPYALNLHVLLKQTEISLKQLIDRNAKITRLTVSKNEALKRYESQHMNFKTDIFNYRKLDQVHLYECEGFVNYLYGYMAPSSDFVKDFKLFVYENGWMLQYPRAEFNALIPPFNDEQKYKDALKENARWQSIIKGNTIDLINEYSATKKTAVSLIQMCETKHTHALFELAEAISKQYHTLKLIGIAGPSSSGKTTFAKRLEIELKARGLKPVTISIDDYYLHPDFVPRQENGAPDLEHIESLDLNLFNEHLKALIQGEEVTLPHFNFQTKLRQNGPTLTLQQGDVILIEGIHALNPRLTSVLSREEKFYIYIAPQTQLKIDSQSPIRTSDMRLLRRIVRDQVYRDTSPEQTMEMWPSVREGEFKWIYPFQKEADYVFNSELTYELAILKSHAQTKLEHISPQSAYFMKANYLLKFLKFFDEMDASLVPNHSLLREFIGGSVFE